MSCSTEFVCLFVWVFFFKFSTGYNFFSRFCSVTVFDRIINKLPHHPNGFRCCWCHFSQQPLQLEPLTATMIPMPQTIHEVAQWNKFQWLTQWAKFSNTIVDAFLCTVSIPSFFMAVFLVHLNSLVLSRNGPIIHYFNVWMKVCASVSVYGTLLLRGLTNDIYGFVKRIPAISPEKKNRKKNIWTTMQLRMETHRMGITVKLTCSIFRHYIEYIYSFI